MMHQHYYNGRPHNYKWMTSIIYIYRYMTLCLEGVVSPRSRCRVSCRHGRTAACRVAVVAPPPVVLLPMPSCCRVLCHRRVCCPSCCGRAAVYLAVAHCCPLCRQHLVAALPLLPLCRRSAAAGVVSCCRCHVAGAG